MTYRGVCISGQGVYGFCIGVDVIGGGLEFVKVDTNLLSCQRAESGDGEGTEKGDSLECSRDMHVEEHRVGRC